ncbi:MAG: hypothetical protein PHC34_11995 [Candidatus Gastranaerophilales bacterium]|nr:hypothetical protein [Candidatus Gastranaerophilales bacterium]
MNHFDNGVPFDPGFSGLSVTFSYNIQPIIDEITKYKAPHQKKFILTRSEPTIIALINKCTSFYLGCMLWGSYICYKFKDNPKEIIGNHTLELSEEEAKQLDCAQETDSILDFIARWDRDYKYFLKKPFKVDSQIIEILKTYKEFAVLNDNFTKTKSTSDIKLPEALNHFSKHSQNQLNDLYSVIMDSIKQAKIENLLKIGFYL